MSERLTPSAETLQAASAWATAWRRAVGPRVPEKFVGQRMKALSDAEAELLRAVRRLERAEKQMSETANNP